MTDNLFTSLKQAILGLFLLIAFPATADEDFSKQLFEAFTNKQLTPHISLIMPGLSEQSAYKIQKNYVQLRQQQDPVTGYKAGLTSQAGQQKFSVSGSLSGALFASGQIKDGQKISIRNAGKLMLETELGFILSKAISQPVKNPQELTNSIESIAAIVELPDLGYVDLKKLKGIDLIAANLASHQYIIGDKVSIGSIGNINQITTHLSYNGKEIFKGMATDAQGDQWVALHWLVNHLLEQGYQLSAGDLLITGALGKMVAANSGDYLAQFGPLGQINFKITP